MVKKTLLNFSGKVQLSYILSHPGIPAPRMGFSPDWKGMHAHIPNLGLDHEHCPGIQARENLGITVHMPYTCRFFRDGRLEIETFWEDKGPSIFTVQPFQSKVEISSQGDLFPGFRVILPESPALRFPLNIFVLGDVRVNAWIVQAGIFLAGLPEDYTLMINPLPNYKYPPGYSVGQAMVLSLSSISGQLKIPIDVDFASLPADQEAVVIPRGTPMVQYVPVKLPEVELKAAYSK